mmetsp:Transcript_15297/g.25240  ORF Transcript_15297/g.25240 Transcript_15297/m.25240 type:complete len:323 (-) Transcript_15297:202-1170(-)
MEDLGGLHRFMNWDRGLLTDSGGFQMVSLLKLAEITEEGVTFQSPVDGTPMLLTPEKSIDIQNKIGADIIMALDDVVPSTTTDPARFEEATYRTLRWLRRCIKAHQRPGDQNLFGIVQGGLDPELREVCLRDMVTLDLPGYAIGGLAGGEDKNLFWRVVAQCTAALPENKPRYCMGVGYPVDLVVCVALGVDMFDCVFPSRTARFGTALVPMGMMNLKNSEYGTDYRPIDASCHCMVCKKYTRAYLHTVAGKEAVGGQLLTYHNIAYQMSLMRSLRQAIINNTFPDFVRSFIQTQYPANDVPGWIVDALEVAGIPLTASLSK